MGIPAAWCDMANYAARNMQLLHHAGFGYAAEATRAFLHEAELAGAELRCSEPVSALQLEEGRVTGKLASLSLFVIICCSMQWI